MEGIVQITHCERLWSENYKINLLIRINFLSFGDVV